MSGMYFPMGDLRKVALEMAIESADEPSTDGIVARAESYFRFLTGDLTDGQI